MPLRMTSGPEVNKSVSRQKRKNTRHIPGVINPKRASCRHLIPQDLLLSCTSCLSRRSAARVSFAGERKLYYAAATMDHNGPLFWLHVAERSLVSHVSSAANVPSLHFHAPPPSPLVGLNLHAGIISIAHQGWSLRRKQAFPFVNILGARLQRLGQVRFSFLTRFFF